MKLIRINPRQRWLPAALLVAGLIATSTPALAADDVTVMLRSGEKVAGQLEDLAKGTIYVRVSRDNQRKLPVGDVALIDFVGGASGLPETELSKARGDDHLLVLRNSNLVSGRLTDIEGGEGSDEPNKPRVFVFRTSGGEERRVAAGEVGRVYLGRYPAEDGPSVPTDAKGVRVPASKDWVATGVYVIQGQPVTFEVQGEVQLSAAAGDRAKAAGAMSGRRAAGAPLPSILAGALIGKVGTNGQPFGIGDQGTIPMPAGGELYLAVNDDARGDNQGEFAVQVKPGQAKLPQPQRRPRLD
jgi:hypothetical protein